MLTRVPGKQDSPRWIVGIRPGLLIAFAVVVVPVLCMLLMASLLGMARLSSGVAGSLMFALGRDAEVRLHSLFDPFRQKVLEDYAAIREGRYSVKDAETLRSMLTPGLFALPRVDSVALGDQSGGHFLVMRYNAAVRGSSLFAAMADSLPMPDSGRLQVVTREFRPAEWGDASRWALWEYGGRQVVQEWTQPLLGFDTRQRPWFRAAMEAFRDQTLPEAQAAGSSLVAWTDVFTPFAPTSPGISAAVAARDPAGDILVVSYNLPLDDVAQFTMSAQPSPRGMMFVMTDDGRLLGPPRAGRTEDARRTSLQPIAQAGVPNVARAVSVWKGHLEGKSDLLRVALEGETWWAGFTPFDISPKRRLWIGMLLPESDLVPKARQYQRLIAGVGGLALILAAWVAMGLARRFAEPLAELAAQSRRIASLDLADTAPVRSRLAEVNLLSTAVRSMRDALRTYISNLHDAADRQRALEGQLRETQKLEAVGLLAGGIAHDFNNLLQVVAGNAGLALEADGDAVERRAALDAIVTTVEQASQLTRQLLTIGRRQAMHRERVEINSLVTSHMAMIRRLIPENIRIECRSATEPLIAAVDKGQMEQVLLNLCLNARDAMPYGGELSIAIEPVSLDAATAGRLCRRPAGPFARITVSDTGHGMTAAALERIFEPFFTTKTRDKGSGLGLAVVHGIIGQHGGHIAAGSVLGRGTQFVMLLPCELDEQVPATATPPAPPADRDQGPVAITILLAEDDAAVRRAAERVLTRIGATVVSVADGPQAVDRFAAHPEGFDLLILDVMMPGLSGLDVAARCRELRPDIAVLFASGYAAESVGAQVRVTDNGAILLKPYDPETLRTAVRKLAGQAKKIPTDRISKETGVERTG
jgi:signal transduction histidine kinase/ActR/RegA family two-component response regulator